MGAPAKTLTAISLGAVFMGVNTYVGSAPFMVYTIARRAGVNMPTFFPYMVWSGVILLPVFAAVTWLFLMTPIVPKVSVAPVQDDIAAAEKPLEPKFYTVKPAIRCGRSPNPNMATAANIVKSLKPTSLWCRTPARSIQVRC
jgi:hypothetical protein